MNVLFPDPLPGSSPALRIAATGAHISFAELAQRTDSLANLLDVGRKALAFCFFRNDLASIENYLACLTAGTAAYLADPAIDSAMQQRLVALYEPDWVLSSSAADERYLPEGGYERAPEAGAGVWWRRKKDRPRAIHSDLAVLLSTSGSTGSSKLARLSLRNLVSNAGSIAAALSLAPDHRPITSLPLHYSYGLSVLNSHLATGAETVVTAEPILSAGFWDTFRQYECTSWAGVPYSYQVLRRLDLRNLKLPSLRDLTQAGGKLQNDLIAHFHGIASSFGVRFWVMYGQTEATARISILPSSDLPERIGSAGRAIPGGELWTENGELFYRGPNVMLGYATSPEQLGAGDELQSVLATGDLGYMDVQGYCYVTGRLKRIAKLMGVRVNLDEVEQMVRSRVPAAVVGRDDRLVIFAEQNDDALFQSLKSELSEHLRLNHTCFTFRYIPALPVNTNGKVDYPKLQEQL